MFIEAVTANTTPETYLIAGIVSMATALGTLFAILIKQINEKAAAAERHATTVQGIMETIGKDTINTINNNNKTTDANTEQTKHLSATIANLPEQMRAILRDK